MVLGNILLLIVAGLIYLGVGERVLDHLGLTDKAAIGFVLAMVIGTFITLPFSFGGNTVSFNLGGLVPIVLGIYVLTRASAKEVRRCILGIVVTTAIVLAISKLFIFDVNNTFIDSSYLWAIIAAVVAYVIGRSRRAAFVSAVLSINLLDIINFFWMIAIGGRGSVMFGGAGILDVSVIAGLLALILVELVGETLERMQGGHHSDKDSPQVDQVEYAGALVDLQEAEKAKGENKENE